MGKTVTNLKKAPLQMRGNPEATGVGPSKGSLNHSKQTPPKKPQLETRAENASSFFDGLFARFDDESHLVTIEEKDPELRMRMRRVAKRLKDMIAFAQRFHGHRFSDQPNRIAKAAEEARQLVDLHDKLHRHERDWESIKMVKRFDQLTTSHPQPEVFGRKFLSWASATLGVMLLHYGPLVDAFEASEPPPSLADKPPKPSIRDDFNPPPLWTAKAFRSLCARLDAMKSLSFCTSVQLPNIDADQNGAIVVNHMKRERPGRPRKYDPDEERILKALKSGQLQTSKECANELKLTKWGALEPWKRVERVRNREKTRRSRARLKQKKQA